MRKTSLLFALGLTFFILTIVPLRPAAAATVAITVTTSPFPLTNSLTVDGTVYSSPQTFTWTTGSIHTIAALSTVAGGAGTQYVWISWSDAGAQSHSVTTPAIGTTYTASYKTQYFLTVNGGSGGSNGQGWHDSGTVATATSLGAYNRISGTGQRVVAYNVDGGANTVVATVGSVTISPTMNAPHAVNFLTATQFQLTLDVQATGALSSVTAPTIPGDNYWYDSGAPIVYTGTGVFGRGSGSGSRVTGWYVDVGAVFPVSTSATFSTSPISMIGAHTIHLTIVTQYSLSLDAGATSAISVVTSPTLTGDNYWYDSGTNVRVVLNGIWGRANGVGLRLKSYSLNGGGSTSVSTIGTVTAVNLASITAAQSITTVTANEYQLILDAGGSGALTGITAPTLQGDNYWYDSGISVTYVGNGIFGRNAGTGSRVSSWRWDGGSPVSITTAGTFAPASVTMSAAHVLHTTTVSQYQLMIGGTYSISSVTAPTIPGDNYWYDGGSTISLTLNGIFGRSSGAGTRMTSFSINGLPSMTASTLDPVAVLSSFSMTSVQSISVSSTSQYQVTLDPVSAAALNSVKSPTLNGDNYWYDSGTAVVVRLNGIWGRGSGTGSRLVSYSINGGAPFSITSDAAVSVLNVTSLSSPQDIAAAKATQFYVKVNGGNNVSFSIPPTVPGDTGWYDAGSSLKVSSYGIYGRVAGTGFRVTSWNVDGGTTTAVATTGLVTTSTIIMSTAHSVSFDSVSQYQVSLDSGALDALSLVTPPTLVGDGNWYDAGTSINVVLQGAWGRASGSGHRLISYSADGGPPVSVATTGNITALSVPSLSSRQSVNASSIIQHQLTVPKGWLVSLTSLSIIGDSGWYDSGATVTATFNYVSNETARQSRESVVGYKIDGSEAVLSRSGGETFSVSITMNAAHAVTLDSVVQYYFQVVGPPGTSFSPPSRTNDSWYDAGVSVSASFPYTWNSTPDGTRQSLVSYTLDGAVFGVQRAGSGYYKLPPISFGTYHDLFASSVTQYLVTFTFADASGSRSIVPSSFQVSVEGQGVVNLQGAGWWSDAGKTVVVSTVIWEGVDVKSAQSQTYRIDSPSTLSVPTRVFDAKLTVVDLFGIPISGASTSIRLANGTSIDRQTASDGTIVIRMIPLGTFKATVSNLGVSTEVAGDASVQSDVKAKVLLSVTFLILIVVLIVAIVGGLFLTLRIRRRGRPQLPLETHPA